MANDYEDFDLQGQLDDNLGYDYNSDLQDNSQAGASYLQNQGDWNFGNYGDMNFNDQLSNTPLANWNTDGTNWGQVDNQLGSQFNNPMADIAGAAQQFPQQLGGIQNTLAGLFGNKGFTTGLAALIEGSQNKKKAAAMQNLANQVRQSSDPFGSQRPFYQQQLQQAVQNPYSSPIVANQVSNLERVQAMKDAAAGRRSNSALSNPATLAAASEVAQKYMNSLMQPAGANIAPNQSVWSQLAAQGINNDVNGYMSPLASALGYNQQNSNTSDALINALQKALGGK